MRMSADRGASSQPRHMAQTIAPPIMTKTTGRNHLSSSFCIGRPGTSAALPLEMSDAAPKRDLANRMLPESPRSRIKNLLFL